MKKSKTTGPTIDQDGEVSKMPHLELDTLPRVNKAFTVAFNAVRNKEVSDTMNRSAMGALKTQTTMIDSMVKAQAGLEALQSMTAQFCGVTPTAIADGTKPKPKKRRTKSAPTNEEEPK